MTTRTLLTLLTAVALTLPAGCKKEDAAAGAAGTSKKAVGAALAPVKVPSSFALVPADSPYVFANTRSIPAAAFAKIFKAVEPLLTRLDAELAKELASPTSNDEDKLAHAVLEELKGKLNIKGLESLGFSTTPRFTIYGLGLLPVFRIELKDPKALRAAIGRVEAKAGVKAPVLKAGDKEYWGVTKDDMTILVAITDNELVFAVTPAKVASKTVPMILGQQKPAKSLASAGTFESLSKTYGFQGFGTGYVDLRIIASTLLGESAGLNKEVWTALGAPIPALPPNCNEEIQGLVKLAPRAVFGYTEMSDTGWTVSWILEMERGLAGDLAGLSAAVPGIGSGGGMFSFGVGLDVGKTIAFAKKTLAAAAAKPFECPLLRDMNYGIKKMNANISSVPIPPFVNGIKGFNLIIKSGDFGGGMPKGVKAIAVVAMDKPGDLLKMAGGMVPPLAQLKVPGDGTPVPLPAGLIPPVVDAPHIAMKGSALAVSVGVGEEKGLSAALTAASPAKPPLISVTYDPSKMASLIEKELSAGMGGAGPDEKAGVDMAMNIIKIFGPITYSVRLDPKGLVMTQRLKLN